MSPPTPAVHYPTSSGMTAPIAQPPQTLQKWASAKRDFAEAVRVALDELMATQGLSRERGVATILHQIEKSHEKPSDEVVFAFMQKHGLGNEQALLALAASAALRNRVAHSAARGKGRLHALYALTKAVRHAPTLPVTLEEGTDDLSTEPSNILLPPLKISTEVMPSKSKGLFQKSVNTKPSGKANRKRALEITADTETKRRRADSLSEDVSAKLEETVRPVASDAKVKPTAAVRGKRSRSAAEEGETASHGVALATVKRSRNNTE